MQAASLTADYTVVAARQPEIAVCALPNQLVASMAREMCKSNRTSRAEGSRYETKGLMEIDEEMNRVAKDELTEEQTMRLNIVRTGSAWHQGVACKAGLSEPRLSRASQPWPIKARAT